MAPQTNQEHLVKAWRALSGATSEQGWRLVDISRGAGYIVKAGRRAPGNEETLLIGIRGANVDSGSKLPRGHGFSVVPIELSDSAGPANWIAVVRSGSGQLGLFTLMAADLVALLDQLDCADGNRILMGILSRIRAWQDFMKKDRSGVLDADAEVGLFGELLVLKSLSEQGVMMSDALAYWVGPDDGLHDFQVGTGAIEVKTTVAPTGFFAEIANLDQLDDCLRKPLYIASIRLSQAPSGQTLPELCDDLASTAHESDGSSGTLLAKLLSAGYVASLRENYTRRFVPVHLSYRLIEAGSPRLTRGNVPTAVQRVKYTLDLEAIPEIASEFAEIATSFGASTTWN